MHEVKTAADRKSFLQVSVDLYKNDSNWIRPLDKDIEEVFDPGKNKFFKRGECTRWLLKDNKGKAIGRVAAFVNRQYKNEQPTGGIGFFDCIDDQASANFIFDHCKKWLQDRGMEAMDGPINFGERDKWWGLLVEGFYSPLYNMNYNPQYYRRLFEEYGFKTYFNQVCFGRNVTNRLDDKFYQRHDTIAKDANYKAVMIRKTQIEKFAKDFTYIYNKAWAGHGGLKSMAKEQAVALFKTMKPVMDENIIWFAYHKEEPIAIYINLPDLNKWFKYLNGKFGLFHKLKFLWIKKTKPNIKFTGVVFGVVPEWQGKGIDAFIIGEAANKFVQTKKSPYTEYEMQWIGDFNPKMINVAESLGDTFRSRTLTTYRYLFDRMKEFKRHPMV